ncbi:hypothetical protein OTU49_013269 [Cherax quadricarinatus]|uniref:Uncharacterized protein n=1 Tax=Cherax quadricarinatus TaxID=27406 RepID=A0AAW0VT58_CHEQU
MDLQTLRCLKGMDVYKIFAGTPRQFGKVCKVLVGDDGLMAAAPLRRGEGFLYTLRLKNCFHSVSIYRCFDGRYLYFDPTTAPADDSFHTYRKKHNIRCRQVTEVKARF